MIHKVRATLIQCDVMMMMLSIRISPCTLGVLLSLLPVYMLRHHKHMMSDRAAMLLCRVT